MANLDSIDQSKIIRWLKYDFSGHQLYVTQNITELIMLGPEIWLTMQHPMFKILNSYLVGTRPDFYQREISFGRKPVPQI